MTDFNDYLPAPSVKELLVWLDETQHNTLCLMDDLTESKLTIGKKARVNLPLWELGHIAWFQEFWMHRRAGELSILPHADQLYDSSAIAHQTRWNLSLPDMETTRSYLVTVCAMTRKLLESALKDSFLLSPEQSYFLQLSTFHQDMHNEAFCYTRQSLLYPLPEKFQQQYSDSFKYSNQHNQILMHQEDVLFKSPTITLGAIPGHGFYFDNEKLQHTVALKSFSISPSLVTNQEMMLFVEQSATTLRPEYWEWRENDWWERKFDCWMKVDPQAIVMHVSYDVAEAYCVWAGRRLPTESEWQCMAESPCLREGFVSRSGVWEWTSSVFSPFAGFSPDPYRDYSEPWFDGTYQVLRGSSWLTPSRLQRIGYRNFYQKNRSDIFCGFRTCAL